MINLGWLEYMDGRLESAITHCNQGLEIVPKHAMGYNDRGAILEDMGRIDKALADYARAIELNNDPEAEGYARINRALANLQQADHASAEQDLLEVIRRNLPMKEAGGCVAVHYPQGTPA